jgi:hypothetical protein
LLTQARIYRLRQCLLAAKIFKSIQFVVINKEEKNTPSNSTPPPPSETKQKQRHDKMPPFEKPLLQETT